MPAATLHSIVLNLTPAATATIPKTLGHQIYAPLLAAIRAADPPLAHALHTNRAGIRPFTISPVRGVRTVHDGTVVLQPDAHCWLRLTLLEPALYARFMERFLPAEARPAVRLGRAELRIRDILTVPAVHPGLGCTTWAALAEGASTAAEITLEFKSPTAFSFGDQYAGKRVVLLPGTELVFDSLARTWNEYAPERLRIDRRAVCACAAEHVVARQFGRLETHLLRLYGSLQVGFVGKVTYTLADSGADMRRQFNMLADFAFYAGVGMKPAMGMGQCCRK